MVAFQGLQGLEEDLWTEERMGVRQHWLMMARDGSLLHVPSICPPI